MLPRRLTIGKAAAFHIKYSRSVTSVSIDQTHHLGADGRPMYGERYSMVTSFHAPEGLAAVKDSEGKAFHVDTSGTPAYPNRFRDAYGFYNGLAAVADCSGWHHITRNGAAKYERRFRWCGNFSALPTNAIGARLQAPVTSTSAQYFHINENGITIGGPYLYAGDPNSHGQSVVWSLNGSPSIIDADRAPWGLGSTSSRTLLDARAPHKGIAAVKDRDGWFFMNHMGEQVGTGRYELVEDHYNGQARVKLSSGNWALVDLHGNILRKLGQPLEETKKDLLDTSMKYWQSIAMKMIIENRVLDSLWQNELTVVDEGLADPKLKDTLLNVSEDMGLCERRGNDLVITEKGRLVFASDDATSDRLKYWLQDRYFKAWLPQLSNSYSSPGADHDCFAAISSDYEAVALSHRVLSSYAQQDWKGVGDIILRDRKDDMVIVDLAGGTGSLLEEIAKTSGESSVLLICLERPEVVAFATKEKNLSSPVQFISGDLFSGPLPKADRYILSRVLHDWNDEKAGKILNRIRRQSDPDATLIVVERQVTSENSHSLLSLHMNMLQKSFERTPEQWKNLFDGHGWKIMSQEKLSGHSVMSLKKTNLSDMTVDEDFINVKKLRKAVIPIAGRGMRMAPQSTVTPKAILPIITTDHNGNTHVAPALTNLLDQLFSGDTGIQEACIVASPSQRDILQRYLSTLEPQINKKISIAIQRHPLGFGDAILSAQQFTRDSPFLVALGDHLYSDGTIQELVSTYNSFVESGNPSCVASVGLTGAVFCDESQIKRTGLLKPMVDDGLVEFCKATPVSDMAEKPMDYHRFAVGRRYLSQLGLDVLPPSIFAELSQMKSRQSEAEICLRSAMRRCLMEQGNLYLSLVHGKRYDIGDPSDYLSSLIAIHGNSTEGTNNLYNDDVNTTKLARWLGQIGLSHHVDKTRQAHIASSPGRVDLMGGFADYSGSRVLQYPTAKRTFVMTSLTNMHKSLNLTTIQVKSINDILSMPDHFPTPLKTQRAEIPSTILWNGNGYGGLSSKSEVKVALEELLGANQRWPLYVVGVFHATLEKAMSKSYQDNDFPSGANITVVSDLPWNSGLSSSAAVEMATALSCGKALQLSSSELDPTDLAIMCQNVESAVLDANTGLMDQIAVSHASVDSLSAFSCRLPFENLVQSLPLPPGLSVVAVDSGVSRSNVDSPYNRTRVASLMGQFIINQRLMQTNQRRIRQLCDLPKEQFPLSALPLSISGSSFLDSYCKRENKLHDYSIDPCSNYLIRAATSHPIEENERVRKFENVLKSWTNSSQDRLALGDLMKASHDSYTNCGMGNKDVDYLRKLIADQPGVIGARISGGGAGGSLSVLMCDDKKGLLDASSVMKSYQNVTGQRCRFHEGSSPKLMCHGTLRRHFTNSCRLNSVNNKKPTALIVNHGYPPDFNGGSEVYSQVLALELHKAEHCNVYVMAREQDPFRPDFEIRKTSDDADRTLPILLMNFPREAAYQRYQSTYADEAFRAVLREVNPDIVHFQHLNHLSLNFSRIAKEEMKAQTLYTLHDYWLMCPRGQFLVTGVTTPDRVEPWEQCHGQRDVKCATDCYTNRYGTGCEEQSQSEIKYWTNWVSKRMFSVRSACEYIDGFIAPSHYLRDKYIKEFGLSGEQVQYMPYGFDLSRLNGRNRVQSNASDPFVFAYIGRHQPSKGINLLVTAAALLLRNDPDLLGRFKVRIYGRADMNSTNSLKRMMNEALPDGAALEVFEWHNEYNNFNIVDNVFNHIDAVVVPSIWEENSPLVIHEAQQCRVPVITSDYGGMRELVSDDVNGLLFEHRSSISLSKVMLKALDSPHHLKSLGKRGYLFSEDGNIPSISKHGTDMKALYLKLMDKTKANAAISPLPAPWRITFDTNPDDCNFSCAMCEQHSEFSPFQKERKEQKIRRRRMPIKLIQDTVRSMAPLGMKECIPTTMGEPLQYKDFKKILDLCDEQNVKLNLTTNGSFFGIGASSWAEMIVPLAVDVKISWNGISEETQQNIMKNSKLQKQIENLKKFIAVRDRIASEGGNYCSVTLQLTFMEQNLREIPQIIAFAIENGVDRVKGHHLWAHFDEIKDENLRRNDASIERWNATARECRDYAAVNKLKNGKTIRLDNFFDLEKTSTNEEPIHTDAVCPFLGKEAWINHEGRFDPCCAPDEQRKSLGYFGNINNPGESLNEIWNSEKYRNLCENYMNKPLCRGCNMRRPP